MTDRPLQTIVLLDAQTALVLAEMDEWDVLLLAGSLSADPYTLPELATAWQRYAVDRPLMELDWRPAGTQAADPPRWVSVDLARGEILVSQEEELFENPAAFQRDEGNWEPGNPIVWINLPPRWTQRVAPWSAVLAQPEMSTPEAPFDFREFLFGAPLAAGLARRVLVRAQESPSRLAKDWLDPDGAQARIADAVMGQARQSESNLASELEQRFAETRSAWHELTVEVHVDWLMTPHPDLNGDIPRHYLHRGLEWVDRELSNRQREWENEGRAPVGVEPSAVAYRFGPMGRHELCMYFDLCRELLAQAWQTIHEQPDITEPQLTAHLHQHAQSWLHYGRIDGNPMPPIEILDSERRRIPLLADGAHIIDCECPLCRMMADESFGLTFCSFDGHHLELDDEFAFSLCATRAEWDKQQADYRDFAEKCDAREKQRQADIAAGLIDPALEPVWSNSVLPNANIGNAFPAFSLSFRVAELVTDLQTLRGHQPRETAPETSWIANINDLFDSLRNSQASGERDACDAICTALVTTLEQVVTAYPNLTSKAADLQSQLYELSRELRDEEMPF